MIFNLSSINDLKIIASNNSINNELVQKIEKLLIVLKKSFAISLVMKKKIHPNYHSIKS